MNDKTLWKALVKAVHSSPEENNWGASFLAAKAALAVLRAEDYAEAARNERELLDLARDDLQRMVPCNGDRVLAVGDLLRLNLLYPETWGETDSESWKLATAARAWTQF